MPKSKEKTLPQRYNLSFAAGIRFVVSD